jgi:hypothetical protein
MSDTDCLNLPIDGAPKPKRQYHDKTPTSRADNMRRVSAEHGREAARKVTMIDQTTLRMKAQLYTDLALATLVEICEGRESKNAQARVRAAQVLLDRGWGVCTQEGPDKTNLNTRIQVVFADSQKATIIESHAVPEARPEIGILPDHFPDQYMADADDN